MYAATVEGRPLTFEVAAFWRRNMVMRDRETSGIWQQATGECLAGPLRGRHLEPLGGVHSTWSAWHAEHPDALVAMEPAHAPKGLAHLLPTMAIWAWLEHVPFTLPGRAASDPRLAAHEEVAGISLAGAARAYPLSGLRRQGVINDVLSGIPIAVAYDPRGDRVRAFHRRIGSAEVSLVAEDATLTESEGARRWRPNGEPVGGGEHLKAIPITRQFWLAWSEFHPGTSVYGASE